MEAQHEFKMKALQADVEEKMRVLQKDEQEVMSAHDTIMTYEDILELKDRLSLILRDSCGE